MRAALVVTGVVVGKFPHPEFLACSEERTGRRVCVSEILHVQRTRQSVMAVPVVRMTPFGRVEEWEHIVVAPPNASVRSPRVVVRSVTANPHLRVDVGAPAQAATAGPIQLTSLEVRLRDGRVVPVELGLEQLAERRRYVHLHLLRYATGFQQRHRYGRIGREAIGQHRACVRTRS